MAGEAVLSIAGFPKGLNNRAKPEALPEGTCQEAVNMLFDNTGRPRRRKGLAQVYSGSGLHSLFSYQGFRYFAEGTSLKRLNPDDTATVVASGLLPDVPVVYATLGDQVFWACGSIIGRLADGVNWNWGLSVPEYVPVATAATTGGMFAGTYQVTITWRDASGVESGAPAGRSVDVPEGGGIRLTGFPAAPEDAAFVSVYVSTHNGTGFFLYDDYPLPTSVVELDNRISSTPLETQFALPPVGADALLEYNGRIYLAVGNHLMFTDAFNPHLIRPGNAWSFEHPIVLMRAVFDGFYVATSEQTFFVTAVDAEEFPVRRKVHDYGAVPGSAVSLPTGNQLLVGWMTPDGFLLAGDTGQTSVITRDQIQMGDYTQAASVYVEDDGLRYVVCSCRT